MHQQDPVPLAPAYSSDLRFLPHSLLLNSSNRDTYLPIKHSTHAPASRPLHALSVSLEFSLFCSRLLGTSIWYLLFALQLPHLRTAAL